MNTPQIIKRFGPPNSYDLYPYGTICMVADGTVYKQISREEECPLWEDITEEYYPQEFKS